MPDQWSSAFLSVSAFELWLRLGLFDIIHLEFRNQAVAFLHYLFSVMSPEHLLRLLGPANIFARGGTTGAYWNPAPLLGRYSKCYILRYAPCAECISSGIICTFRAVLELHDSALLYTFADSNASSSTFASYLQYHLGTWSSNYSITRFEKNYCGVNFHSGSGTPTTSPYGNTSNTKPASLGTAFYFALRVLNIRVSSHLIVMGARVYHNYRHYWHMAAEKTFLEIRFLNGLTRSNGAGLVAPRVLPRTRLGTLGLRHVRFDSYLNAVEPITSPIIEIPA
ncbi:hypothetical protein F4604DRAFT_1675971 [Suillus subluteus]|nr:hypothetical protein F4604DRAFT_1675971 [Suillus subluteus]